MIGKFYALLSLTSLAIAVVGSRMLAPPGQETLEVCNKSQRGPIHVGIAHPHSNNRWQTEGWLTLAPGECGTALAETVTNRYYYYYAQTESAYAWRGTHSFCVADGSFTFDDAAQQCNGIHSRWEGFRELDTGNEAKDFTLNLE